MLTNTEIKRLAGLQDKKNRRQLQLFTAETPKVTEVFLCGGIKVKEIYALACWLNRPGTRALIKQCERKQGCGIEVREISPKELERISALKTPQDVVLVAELPDTEKTENLSTEGVSLVLDDIRDPGNLGTILRVADWFGIDCIICTKECADCYQSKCVQSSMGSLAVSRIQYCEREQITGFIKAKKDLKVYGTFLQGESIYKAGLAQENAWYVIGNEAHGIGPDLEAVVTDKITIPPYTKKGGNTGAESLNAAIATAILCSSLRKTDLPVRLN